MEKLNETIGVMQHAMGEIQRLRYENDILKAKVSVMELFRDAIGARVPQQGGEAQQVDPLWVMEKHLSELQRISKVTERLRPSDILSGLQQAQEVAQAAQAGNLNTVPDPTDMNQPQPIDAEYPF